MWLSTVWILFTLIISSSADECGRQKVTQGLSIGGEYSERGQWPWLASIFFRNKYFCGSSIISKKHLLGAAHCVHPKGHDRLLTTDFSAYLALHDLNSKNDPRAVRKQFQEIFIHPEWDSMSKKYDADVALFLVQSEIQFNDYIQPICIPDSNADVFNINGVVVGYGMSENSTIHETLPKHVQIKSVNYEVCLFAEPVYASVGSIRMFCAGSRGKNPCKGDSGGPFAASRNGKFTIIGIVSTALVQECSENDFVLFTKVPAYSDWIKEKMTIDLNSRINTDQLPCGTFLKYDAVNDKNAPSLYGFQGGVNYDSTPQFIGFGNNKNCHENPCAGFISPRGSRGAGAYFACNKEGLSFDTQDAHYLVKNENLKWIKKEKFIPARDLPNILKTRDEKFAWGRIKYEGQYRVGKVKWKHDELFMVAENGGEKYFNESAFEILTCDRGARFYKGNCLYAGDGLISDKNCFRMILQHDGNLVVYRQSDNRIIWATNTEKRGGFKACMQEDGNFVLYDKDDVPLWSTGTNGKGGRFAYLQDDAQLTIRGENDHSIWVSGRVFAC